MIVLDASAVLDFLLHDTDTSAGLARRMRTEPLAAPHLLDSEVAHVLRRHVIAGRLAADRAVEALTDLADLPLDRYPAQPLLSRIWALRHNLSGYDATYVALAEALDAPLLTTDRRLADLPEAVTSAAITLS